MKKIIILCLLLFGCNTGTDSIKRVPISNIITKRQVILISKSNLKNDCTGITRQMAYVCDLNDSVYYIQDIPLEIWNDYFKDTKKGDTITFFH